jgi:WD40 repeat protein
MEKKTAT